MLKKRFIIHLVLIFQSWICISQELPKIIGDLTTIENNYLPDFSYAGYHNGEVPLPMLFGEIILATNYGVIPNDGLDDSKALLNALEATKTMSGNIILQLPAGKLILSNILYIERSNFVLRGTGIGKGGTEIYCPRPMMYLKDPESLVELREYLLKFDKRQREKENNIDLPFSQYAWSGGMIWTQVPGERVKSYLGKYDQPQKMLAKVIKGRRGEKTLIVSELNNLKIGDIVQLDLFNKDGENGSIINDLYKNIGVKVGSHHWEFPSLPIVRQQVEIVKISGNKVTIKTPLTIDIRSEYQAQLVAWKHLKEVGIEHLRITFPNSPRVAHHVEPGYNGIFLTRVFNSWVKDVVIHNADSGILAEETANISIKDIVTTGDNMAHYTVAMAGVHNVLVNNLKVYNNAVHPLSFNTFSTKNVYQNCEVFSNPVLDQHSGANHQNLFDNVKVHLNVHKDGSYPLFAGGGAPYWKPSHGAYSTFWNINIQVENKLGDTKPFVLNGMEDGPFARVIGVHGNHNFKIEYGYKTYIESTNKSLTKTPSLYNYQLKKRLRNYGKK
ncbi:DUF4955 domain-containing protein [Aureibaculum luteum]|uniref:DUF4955 domain-containing protein n=1 Tax=Aureibaculum luteum TaxID=1548456 RepID=UPI000E4E6F6E|nr:DUF4955 domain-containing protein [Aureibaculum luteum]